MEKNVLNILKEIQPDYDFEADVNFVEMGYLDSFDVVTLVSELEETFSIIISALDIVPENFSSLQNICGLIQRSKASER
jgi:acyl carrier protein